MNHKSKPTATKDEARSELDPKTVYELRTLAKQAGIPNCQTLNKPALIERLLQHWEKVKSVIRPQERFWRAHQTALWSILAILVTIAFAWFPWRYPWHTETLEDRLQREYPLGYVLCDVGGPGKQLKNMRFYPDEAVMQADWQDTTAEVDTTKKFARLTIHNPSWKRKSTSAQAVVHGNAVWEGEYSLKTPVEVRLALFVEGAPKMFLEVLDDSGSVVQCVIGLK